MNRHSFGVFCCTIFFLVNFSQIHTLIPGVKYLRPGLLASIFLLFAVIPEVGSRNWYNPLGKYRLLFIVSIIPGLIWGAGTGSVRGVLINSIQDFIGGFIAICVFFSSIKEIRLMNRLILITGLFMALFVLTHGGHGPGILLDENDIGLVLVMLFPFVYFTIPQIEGKFSKIVLVLLLLLIASSIAATLSRGAMVGLLPTLFIIWYKSKNKFLTIVALAILISLVVIFAPPRLMSEFVSIKEVDQGTAGERRFYWDLSMQLFKARPLIGVGAGCWGNAVWSGRFIPVPYHVHNMTPHSIYFQIISELGLLGTISWLMLIFLSYRISRRTKELINNLKIEIKDCALLKDLQFLQSFSSSLNVGITGGLICGMFLSFAYYSHLYTYIALVQAVYVITLQKVEKFNYNIV